MFQFLLALASNLLKNARFYLLYVFLFKIEFWATSIYRSVRIWNTNTVLCLVFNSAELLMRYRRYGVLVIAWWSWMGCHNSAVACGTVIGNRRIFLQGILVLWAWAEELVIVSDCVGDLGRS